MLVELAGLQTAFITLDIAIKTTSRRVNALENVVTPRLENTVQYIKGELDELGRLKLTGRIKEIFKTSKGKYIAPAPIENKLMAHSAIEMVCVSGANQTQPHALEMVGEENSNSQAVMAERGRPAVTS